MKNCYHILENQVIHDYDYRPEISTETGHDTFHELELRARVTGSNAEQILPLETGNGIFTTG